MQGNWQVVGPGSLPVAEERPDSIAGLDLSKPGLLEASAGTGDTVGNMQQNQRVWTRWRAMEGNGRGLEAPKGGSERKKGDGKVRGRKGRKREPC